jgi:hypothetical protein
MGGVGRVGEVNKGSLCCRFGFALHVADPMSSSGLFIWAGKLNKQKLALQLLLGIKDQAISGWHMRER